MSDNDYDYDIQSARALTTRGFQTDPIFTGRETDRADLAKMEQRAILDAVAEQIVQRKGLLAQMLGQELQHQARMMFIEELEASNDYFRRAEKLYSHHARKRATDFILVLWDRYEVFLCGVAGDSGNQIRQIAARSPFPDPEVQRSWLRRLFQSE